MSLAAHRRTLKNAVIWTSVRIAMTRIVDAVRGTQRAVTRTAWKRGKPYETLHWLRDFRPCCSAYKVTLPPSKYQRSWRLCYATNEVPVDHFVSLWSSICCLHCCLFFRHTRCHGEVCYYWLHLFQLHTIEQFALESSQYNKFSIDVRLCLVWKRHREEKTVTTVAI